MLVNLSALMLHIGAVILLAGLLTRFVWRKENDSRKAKFGLNVAIIGMAITIISFAAIEANLIALWNV
jgi:hypothetical protein